MNQYKLVFVPFLFLITLSCSIQYRKIVRDVNKTIVALPESEKGDVVFENDKTGIYFTKKDVLKAFSNIKNDKWITYCERIYLDEIETSIRKANSNAIMIMA